MHRAVVMSCLLMTAGAPAAARAQAPVAPVPVPPPPAAPVQTQMTLTVQRAGGARATALTGTHLRVRGATGAFVPGEVVTVRFFVAGRKRAARRVALQPGASGGGAFVLAYTPRRTGTLVVSATHEAT